MLIDADGAIEGSITGGCVESDVVVNALEILGRRRRAAPVAYGVTDEAAHEVGLMCGGSVEVFVHELRGEARAVCAEAFDAAAGSITAGIATLIEGPSRASSLPSSTAACSGGCTVPTARPLRGPRPHRAQRARHERDAPLRQSGEAWEPG